jgi:hypothetical protein
VLELVEVEVDWKGLISPQNGLISPQKGLISPQKGLISPQNGLISPQNGLISPQKGLISPQKGLISPQDAVIGRAVVVIAGLGSTGAGVVVTAVAFRALVVAVVVLVEDLPEAACACTARRETPAMAAKAIELLRFEILRDMTASSGRNDTDEQPAYDPSEVNGS